MSCLVLHALCEKTSDGAVTRPPQPRPRVRSLSIIIYIYYLFTDTHASIRGTGGHLVECPMRSWDGLDSGTYMKGGHPWNVQQSHETVG